MSKSITFVCVFMDKNLLLNEIIKSNTTTTIKTKI